MFRQEEDGYVPIAVKLQLCERAVTDPRDSDRRGPLQGN